MARKNRTDAPEATEDEKPPPAPEAAAPDDASADTRSPQTPADPDPEPVTRNEEKPVVPSNKAAFIRKHAHLEVQEIIAEGKKVGLELDSGYVSSQRSKAKPGKGRGAKKGNKAPTTGAAVKNSEVALHPVDLGPEAEFKRYAVIVGPKRARELLLEVEKFLGKK